MLKSFLEKYKKIIVICLFIPIAIVIIALTPGKVNEEKNIEDKVSEANTSIENLQEKIEVNRQPVVIKDLGVPINRVKGAFESPKAGFVFESSPLKDGSPRLLANKGTAIVELEGDTNISKADILVMATGDDRNNNKLNALYMMLLLDLICPEFEDRNTWLNNAIWQVGKNDNNQVTKVVNDKIIKLELTPEFSTFYLEITPV